MAGEAPDLEETGEIEDSQKIAIVGIGCRFPGGINNVDAFWKVLEEGKDCSSPHPDNRYDASYFLSPGERVAGKMYNLGGSYIAQNPYNFDWNFFKMPRDEAQHLDPIIRLLLEVTWEALEDAGMAEIRGSDTGVYIGGMNNSEYKTLLTVPEHNIGQYTNSGNTSCMMANRISYEFDFKGPSLALDTACSSSLYALYLACEALKHKQCRMAVAGGANMMLLPHAMIGLCQAGMVSPDGKSKSFDESADGYGRGEGFGVVVLKTLEQALKDKDRIYSVIRGGALSNDGRTTGITSPSAEAQRKLLKAACLHAKVAPTDIMYVEAHGTGTQVGDKAEASVLGEFFGQRRSKDSPLPIGSVKSNFGHTEGAAGVAGVIKSSLCLQHRKIPRVVHFKKPNPALDFDKLNIHVPQSTISWPGGKPLIASCSSFGFGGANACVILEAAPSNSEVPPLQQKPIVLVISATSKEALKQRLVDWLEFLQRTEKTSTSEQTFHTALYTAAQRSHHHQHRLCFVVTSVEDTIALIQHRLTGGDFQSNTADSNLKIDMTFCDLKTRLAEGKTRSFGSKGKIAFMFSGMGTQWWGMARDLMQNEPAFAVVIKTISQHLKTCGATWCLINMLSQESDVDKINETDIAQPCICAIQIALVELWRKRGVVPDVIVGHSVGEVAAAYCAGLLSLEHAINLIYHRGKQLSKNSGSGTMLAVMHPVKDVIKHMHSTGFDQKLDVAASNSPNQVVVSGDTNSIRELMTEFKDANIQCKQLKVSNAFHSRQQDCLRSSFKTQVNLGFQGGETGKLSDGSIPMVSTVIDPSSYLSHEKANTPEYWWSNIRHKVSFQNAIEKLYRDGSRIFVEIGSHPVLLQSVKDTIAAIPGSSDEPISVGSLSRPQDVSKLPNDRISLLLNHAKLFVSGVPSNFDSYFDDNYKAVVSIPKYPWQREPCSGIEHNTADAYRNPVQQHLLLGKQQQLYTIATSTSKWWKAELTKSSVPWTKDHVIGGSIILPAAAYIEISLALCRELNPGLSPITLQNIDIQKFIYLPEGNGNLETTCDEITPSRVHITVRSYDQNVVKWNQHMEGDIVFGQQTDINRDVGKKHLDVGLIRSTCNESLSLDSMLKTKDTSGLIFGPSFQTTTNAFVNRECTEILSYCTVPAVVVPDFSRYVFHPALLDGCFQSYGLLLSHRMEKEAERKGTLVQTSKQVPSKIQQFTQFREPSDHIIVHLNAYEDDGSPLCDIKIADAQTNEVISVVQRIEFRRFEADAETGPHVWHTEWEEINSPKESTDIGRCLIIPDEAGIAQNVEKNLKNAGIDTTIANAADEFSRYGLQSYFNDTSLNVTDVLVLHPLSLRHVGDLNQVTRDRFRTIQETFARSCLLLISEITALNPAIWPRLVFVTAGAHLVIPGEDVQPLMTYVPSILMTYVHEEPKLRTVSLDVPFDADTTDMSDVIHKAFLHLPSDENIVAIRKCNRNPVHLTFAQRLRVQSVTNIKMETSNISWVIEERKGQAKLSLRLPVPQVDSINSHFLRAFYFVKAAEDSEHADSSVPDEGKLFTIHTGVERKSDKSTAKIEKRRKLDIKAVKTNKVLRITNGIPLLSARCHLDEVRSQLVAIPDNIGCAEAIHIVREYLPAQIFFQDIFPIGTSTTVVFLTNEETSAQLLSFPLLACAMGAQTTVVNSGRDSHASSKKSVLPDLNSCNIIGIENLHKLKSSADLLILPMTGTTLHKQVPVFLRNLKQSGTVLYLYDDIIKPIIIQPIMASFKIIAYSASLPRALCRQTQGKLAQASKAIFEHVKLQHCLDKQLGILHQSPLSETPLVNMTIPHSTIVTVDGEHTKLPFELHADIWTADEDSSYLVTGGTSGFGLCVVKWLVSRGARHVFIISRHAPGIETTKYISEEKKACIRHCEADVTDASQIEQVLTTIKSSAPPLTGIFHLAVQYRDGYLQARQYDEWNTVLETKAFGALLLHQLTQSLQIPLKHFVVSSSIVSLLGNAGQGNYCAANKFLNSLCLKRHHLGLPATAICIGFINTVGYAALNNLVKLGEERGMLSLTPDEVLKAFNVVMTTGQPLIGIGGALIPRRFIQKHQHFMKHHFSENRENFSLYKGVFAGAMGLMDHASGASFKQMLQEKSENEMETCIMDALRTILTTQLGISETLDENEPLLSVGVDSLMSSRISEAILDKFQVTINPVQLINDKTTTKVLQHLIFKQLTEITNVDADKRWITDGPTVDSNLVLVCFPPTGTGPSFYALWTKQATQFGIQLFMVQLPGWEGREGEETADSLNEIVHNVTEALAIRLQDQIFAFFGHSMGSLIGFEVAHQLKSVYKLQPKHIFISSWYAPTLSYPHPRELTNIDSVTLGSLRRVLQEGKTLFDYVRKEYDIKLSFIDETYLKDSSLLLRLLPAIESVANILKTYQCEERDPLSCGMTVFGGKDDQFIDRSLLDKWEHQVAPGQFGKPHIYDGGHMYIKNHADVVFDKIAMVLTTK